MLYAERRPTIKAFRVEHDKLLQVAAQLPDCVEVAQSTSPRAEYNAVFRFGDTSELPVRFGQVVVVLNNGLLKLMSAHEFDAAYEQVKD